MTIHYDSKTDLLYLRIAPDQQEVINKGLLKILFWTLVLTIK